MPRLPRFRLALPVGEAWEIQTWLGKKEENQEGEKGDWCSGTTVSNGREPLLFFNVSSTIQNPLLNCQGAASQPKSYYPKPCMKEDLEVLIFFSEVRNDPRDSLTLVFKV